MSTVLSLTSLFRYQEEAVASRKALDQAQAERDEGLLTLVRLRVEWADAHRSAEDKEAQAAAIRVIIRTHLS